MRSSTLLFAGFLLPLLFGPARAQEPPTPAAGTDTVPAIRSGGPLMDVPIRRSEYRLGAGDLIDIALFGEVNRQMRVVVSPEGLLVMPRIGVARVQGLTIDEAEVQVRRTVLEQLRNVDVYLTLAEVRRFNVFVLGAVRAPGVRAASAVTRVSELLPALEAEHATRRRILLRRADGDTVLVDMARFALLGDLSANPLLREGDAVLVPVLDETVLAVGLVAFPGLYEYRPGESLAEFLHLVTGGRGWLEAADDTVRLARFVGPEQREVTQYTVEAALGSQGRAILIQPYDAVYVSGRANFREQSFAIASGHLRHPGTYPIVPGVTTAADLVAMAGGVTEDAALAQTTLRRRPADQPLVTQVQTEIERMPPELLSEDELRILEIRSLADPHNVVIDFERLIADGEDAFDQPLQHRDVLFVPRLRSEVTVLGAVRQPGIVPFVEGRSVDSFVERAGGFSRLADKGDVVVIKGKLGTRLAADEVDDLDPGDTIIVPFRERRSFVEIMQDVGTIVAPIMTVVLSIIALDNAL